MIFDKFTTVDMYPRCDARLSEVFILTNERFVARTIQNLETERGHVPTRIEYRINHCECFLIESFWFDVLVSKRGYNALGTTKFSINV